MEVHILHTNDVHSEFDRYVRLSSRLRRVHAQLRAQGAHVLCFELGDHIDASNPLTNATEGRINARMIRELPYDGWVFGNNETLTVDKHLWPDLLLEADTPFYCSNIAVSQPERIAALNRQAGDIYRMDGVAIGVFGVTVTYQKLLQTLGVQFADPEQTAWRLAQNLRANGADIVIMLSHLGLRADQELVDQGLPVDLIVGAHTHHFLDGGELRGRTWIVQAGKHGHAFGHAVLDIQAGAVQRVTSYLVYGELSDPPDEALTDVISAAEREAGVWLEEPVAIVAEHLDHSLLGESELVNLLCDQLRVEYGTDLAILNGGVITGGYIAGVIRRRDVLAVCATPMRPVNMRLDGLTILRLLARGFDSALVGRQGFGFGFRGHFVGRLHVSGADVYTQSGATGDAHAGGTIAAVVIGGKPLEEDRLYDVTTSEYVALSPQYAELQGREFRYGVPILRTFLERALKSGELVNQARLRRYHVL
ncbi:MAG: bifunctional metallophosphatase/5'-nucleotidase [Bacilli bacterium]